MYNAVWTPVVGQVLHVRSKDSNTYDRFAVATLVHDVVGHMPCEISKIAWYFLQHGGQISIEVTGRRKLSFIPDKGLVVPCMYTFTGRPAMMKKLAKTIADKKITTQL